MPTVASVPGAALGSQIGLSADQWLSDVREAVGDRPVTMLESKAADGVSGVVSATTAPYRVSRPPINDTSPATISVSVGGTAYTVTSTNPPPAGNNVYVDYDLGYLVFPTAPAAAATIAVTYQTVRWRDSIILMALQSGLRQMFPRFGKTQTDLTLRPQSLVWEYDLPIWLQTPGSRILKIEVRDPDVATEPFRPVEAFERVNGWSSVDIIGSQNYSPAGRFKITGFGPYVELGDLEPQFYHLPIWYAAGTLMLKREALRIRDDRAAPQAGEGGSQPGQQANLGHVYMQQFREEMASIPAARMPGHRLRMRSTYATPRR